jgi:AcrR family transcriptional regulator
VVTQTSKVSPKCEDILKEAQKLFWAKGYDRTSVKDIANACGFTQGNIYNYFQNKEEILYIAILGEMKRLIDMIQPLENDTNTSPIEQLKVFIQRHVEHTLGPPKGKLLHLDFEMRYLSPRYQVEIIQLRDTYDRILRKIIRRGIDAGIFADVDEKIFIYGIASIIVRARVWYSLKGRLSLPEIAEAISEMFLNGLMLRSDERVFKDKR